MIATVLDFEILIVSRLSIMTRRHLSCCTVMLISRQVFGLRRTILVD